MSQRVVVVGGGIAGLAAAHELGAEHEVTLLESTDRVGGKLRREPVAGVLVDVGAEAMLNRRPEGVDLAAAVGLPVEHPAMAASKIWVDGDLKPLPRSLMGVPLDLDDLEASGVLSSEGLARVRQEPVTPVVGDVSVGDLVAARLGDEVVDKLVEPLLGGVYAGQARLISARAALPMLLTYAERGSLLEQTASMPVTYDKPVFAGIPGGMGLLPEAVAASGRFTTRTGVTVRELRRMEDGFELVCGPTTDEEVVEADRVVLALPPAPAARLLANLAPDAAAELAGIETASMAVVTFAFRAEDVPAAVTEGSGFLVPPTEGRRVKASTFSCTKWRWVREAGRGAGPAGGDLVFLRTSLGRHREEATLQVSDAQLVAASRTDLTDAVGLVAEPVDVHVQRWGGGLPQYAVGHLDRVARIRSAVAAVPGLGVCGAAYDGVGIPAVIGSAHRAVADLQRGE